MRDADDSDSESDSGSELDIGNSSDADVGSDDDAPTISDAIPSGFKLRLAPVPQEIGQGLRSHHGE
jgi:hypothetical protein